MVLELVSFGEDAPSGENLEYEPVFTQLEIAAQPGQERQMGDEIVAAEEPDYPDIIAKARDVLAQSHDLRAAVYLAHAELRHNGFPGFAEAIAYVRGCLSDFWETCHPQLDEDDGDPTMRVNAVRGLAAQDTMIRALRAAPMCRSHAFGEVNLRNRLIIDGELEAREDEHVQDAAGFSAAFKDTDAELLEGILAAVRQATEDVDAIDAIFDEQIPGLGPDLSELQKTLKRILSVIAYESGADVEPAGAGDESEAVAAEGGGAGAAAVVSGAPGAINSDRDVLKAIDKITEYYARNEPSNPVPILLARARRLVGADFLTIVNDLAPLGLENVQLVGGITPEEDDGY